MSGRQGCIPCSIIRPVPRCDGKCDGSIFHYVHVAAAGMTTRNKPCPAIQGPCHFSTERYLLVYFPAKEVREGSEVYCKGLSRHAVLTDHRRTDENNICESLQRFSTCALLPAGRPGPAL